jgi:serine/threonine kinase 32
MGNLMCCAPSPVDFDGPVSLWHFYLLRVSLRFSPSRYHLLMQVSVGGQGSFRKGQLAKRSAARSQDRGSARFAWSSTSRPRPSTPSNTSTNNVGCLSGRPLAQLRDFVAGCVKQRAVSNIIQERRLLEEIDSPFICNLRYAFQDDENLFMVLDLMLGGDLRFHLDRMGAMSEEMVRFWMAQLGLALDYLHRKGIVHRYARSLAVPPLAHRSGQATSSRTTSCWTSGATPI